jgi:hypothetical protein
VLFDFGRGIRMQEVFNMMLRTRNRLIFLAPFLTTSSVPLHRLYSIFAEDPAEDRWKVIVLHDDSSFYGIYRRGRTMSFMLKPSHAFHVIIPAVGNSKLLKFPLKAFTRNPYTVKLNDFTVMLHVNQLDGFRQKIEHFFESWDSLTDFGFSKFRVGRKCLESTLPHRSLSSELRGNVIVWRLRQLGKCELQEPEDSPEVRPRQGPDPALYCRVCREQLELRLLLSDVRDPVYGEHARERGHVAANARNQDFPHGATGRVRVCHSQ